jgi:hypothetical protein
MTRGLKLATLAGIVVGFGVAAVPAAAIPSTPGSAYAWAQPGTAPVSTPNAQPPAWIPIGATAAFQPVSDYAWMQPGTAPVATPNAQPPAWIVVA